MKEELIMMNAILKVLKNKKVIDKAIFYKTQKEFTKISKEKKEVA